jgi:hypothetical protein
MFARVDLLASGHRPADLGDPSVPDSQVRNLLMPGPDYGPAAHHQIELRCDHGETLPPGTDKMSVAPHNVPFNGEESRQ